jgi:hypothetical protein
LKNEGLCFHNGGYFSPQRMSKNKDKKRKKELLLLFTLLSVAWALLDSSAEAIW